METPSSTRRVTRSQALAASNSNIPISKKFEESDKGVKSRKRSGKQQERYALVDVTNDSPIVGVAMGSLETPLSSMAKNKSNQSKMTPGSGEALLRGQVKTLLQKVEEEAEHSKLSLEGRPILHVQGLISSPMLLAPTPANTPQLLNLSVEQIINNSGVMPSPMGQELMISEVVTDIFDGKKKENIESEASPVTRSLLSDFSEKSEISESSECKKKTSQEDDDASVWSIQVNASIKDEDEEEAFEEEEDYREEIEYEEEEEEEEYEEDGGIVDELCEGMSKISVNATKSRGKHTRFVYNSDDELVEEEEEKGSPGVLHLKGLPTPKGKHLRFPTEE
ncbi:glutamic acid-rich protein [Vitis riparia]|uniref:glutamic acid-rich protein n=1 Tax=Vitis riparia TaxID=96939 RepID=UPI00155A91AC|nr:glutamic acid-rich protein [Vitis riparia]